MKKIFVTIIALSVSLNMALAQSTIRQEGNVVIADNPETANVTEGNLVVNGRAVVGNGIQVHGGSAVFDLGNYNVFTNDCGGILCGVGNEITHGNGYSFLLGASNIMDAPNSMAGGVGNHVKSVQSFAFGENNIANSNVSFAFGRNTQTLAYFTFAMGFNLVSNTTSQVVIGRWNSYTDKSYQQPYDWIPSDPLFVIGNGSGATNRSNALVVYKNGNTQINGTLKVTSVEVSTPAGGIPMGEFGRPIAQ